LAFDTSSKEFILSNTTKENAIIHTVDLKIGQSGVIIHKYKNDKIIVSKAMVEELSNNDTIIKFEKANILNQDAIPTSLLKPQDGDIFILNHLYNSSLLLVPNFEASQKIKQLYPRQNFLNPDIFAARLKIDSNPVPSAKDIQQFALSLDIGTIFVVTNNQLSILDVNTLKVLEQTTLNINDTSTSSPFFTKVQDITLDTFSFGDDKIENYDKYYTKILGL
jgi:hypothetical protein